MRLDGVHRFAGAEASRQNIDLLEADTVYEMGIHWEDSSDLARRLSVRCVLAGAPSLDLESVPMKSTLGYSDALDPNRAP